MTDPDLPEMPCAELVERITDFLEDALSEEDRARLVAHLAECDACALYLEQLEVTRVLAGALREDDLPPHVRESLLGAFGAWRAGRV